MKKPIILLACAIASIVTNAQIGIGTTTPNSTLDVQGSLAAKTTIGSSSSYTLGSEYTYIYTGTTAATVTLPTAIGITGRMYTIKNASTSSVTLTINTTSSQSIDGLTSQPLNQYQIMTVVSIGSNWNIVGYSMPSGGTSSTSWLLAGNTVGAVQKLGTTTNYDLPIYTNNTEVMRLTAAGTVGIGTSTFNATYPEKLLVNGGTSSNFINAIVAKGTSAKYVQLNVQNLNTASTSASSDVVATAGNGTEAIYYVDMGINGPNNYQDFFGDLNDSYLYSVGGSTAAASGGNLLIGTATAGKDLVLLTGGGTKSSGSTMNNERMRIDGTSGFIGINTNSANSTLSVDGSVSLRVDVQSNNTNYTFSSNDYTRIYTNTGAGSPVWTLPDATLSNGRIHKLINHGNGTITISPSIITGNGTTQSTLTNTVGSNVVEVISDGTSWHKIN
jgi:hypothetical protein